MSSFDPMDAVSLRDPALETRDAIPYLAVQIVSGRDDFRDMSRQEMIAEVWKVIREFHDEWRSIQPPGLS